jgi:DNA-binding MarR family transcriptional regulator
VIKSAFLDKILSQDIISDESNLGQIELRDRLNRELERRFQDEDFLLFCLPTVARHAAHICVTEYASNFDMSVPEWRLMALVGRFEGISAKEISDRLLMDQVAISRAVHKCTKRGFIREMPNSGDRRRKRLAFTAEGRAYFRRFFPRACRLASDMESGLTQSEARTLKKLLKKLDRQLLQMISKSAKDTKSGRANSRASASAYAAGMQYRA